MSLRFINAAEAKKLADQGAALIDVREAHEFAREQIPGSRNQPLSRLAGARIAAEQPVVFFCQSGGRTRMSANALAYVTEAPVYIMDGGIIGWKMAGFPVQHG
jgi:rhodanese-related sulfurtransferase